jgi:hypothetical protein
MYFSWMDFELSEIYREESMKEAHNQRLSRSAKRFYVNKNQRVLVRLGAWLETLGRNLQGIPFNDTQHLNARGASYE